MKKKILFIVVILSFIVFYGCGKKEEVKNETQVEQLAEDEVILENIKYKLEQDDSYYGINFKVASNFRKRDFGNAMNYFSEEIDGSSYFVTRIFYYKNKSIDYAINDSTTSYDKKYETTIDDKTYTVVHFINPTGKDVQTYLYYYKNKNDVYAYCFTASIDLTRLIEIFLKQIVYN